jgi:hypothetical protein
MKRALLLGCMLTVAAVACGRTNIYRYTNFTDAGTPDASTELDGSVPDAGKPCIPGTLTLNRANPVATFVIDRSSSMNDRFDGMMTKWEALNSALNTALNDPTDPVDQSIEIGALIFPVGGISALACLPPGAADLSPALNNVSPLLALLSERGPSGSTPTAGAIDVAAASVMGVRAATASRALVLATDGEPDCNQALDPMTCTCIGQGRCNSIRCLDDARTLDRIAHYADAGLPTYVIGIAPSTDALFINVLNEMAIAGGRPQADAGTSFYGVSSEAELTAALKTISSQVGACVFLSASVPNSDTGISVTLGGQPVPEGTGWIWTDRSNGEVTLLGAFCDQATANLTLPLDATIVCDPMP